MSSTRAIFHDALTEKTSRPRGLEPASRSAGKRVFVITSGYAFSGRRMGWNNAFFLDTARYTRSLTQLVARLSETIPGVEIVIKSHPVADYYRFYDNLCERFPATVKRHWREPMPLAEPIEADVVLFYDALSTLFFAAVRQGLPILSHWGSQRPLARRIMPNDQLAGSDRIEEIASQVREIIEQPHGSGVEAARRQAEKVYRFFIAPPSGGLAEALESTLVEGRGEVSSTLREPLPEPFHDGATTRSGQSC